MQNGHAQPVETPKRGVEVSNKKLDKDGTLVKGGGCQAEPPPQHSSERRILFMFFFR